MADLTYAVTVVADGGDITLGTVIDASFSYGRRRMLERHDVGQATLLVDDPDGATFPGGGGVHGAVEWIGRRVLVSCTPAGQPTSSVFLGQCEDVGWVRSGGPTAAVMSMSLADPFVVLGRADLPAGPYPAELSGARVQRILTSAAPTGWLAAPSAIAVDAGEVLMAPDDDPDGSALDYLQRVAASEDGRLLLRHTDGQLVFRSRNAPHSMSGVTFARDGSVDDVVVAASAGAWGTAAWGLVAWGGPGGGEQTIVPATAVPVDGEPVLTYGGETLVNRAVFARNGWDDDVADDLAGQAAIGQVRTHQRSSLLHAHAPMGVSAAESIVLRFGDAQLQVAGLSVEVSTVTDAQAAQVLGLTVDDVVDVVLQLPGQVPPVEATFRVVVDSVAQQIDGDQHRVTFGLSPARPSFAKWDDPQFGWDQPNTTWGP